MIYDYMMLCAGGKWLVIEPTVLPILLFGEEGPVELLLDLRPRGFAKDANEDNLLPPVPGSAILKVLHDRFHLVVLLGPLLPMRGRGLASDGPENIWFPSWESWARET